MRLRLAALLAAVAGVLMLLAPSPALAQATPTPAPAAGAGAGADNPIVPGANITVTLLDLKGGEGKPAPVPGVSLTVLKDSRNGSEVGTQTTDSKGRVSIGIEGNGTYVVELDPKTLPDGVKLSGNGETVKTVQVKLASSNFVQFQIGAVVIQEASLGSKIVDGTRSGIIAGLLIALAALGLSLIFGTTGLTNFAHGELITFGAIATYVFNRGLGLPVVAAGILAVIASAVFGFLQDRGLWRPLRNRGTGLIAMMIVSIGLALLLRSIFQYGFGGSTRTLSQYVVQGRQSYGPIDLSHKEVAIVLISVVTLLVTCFALMRTRLGKAMRAVSQDKDAARLMGIDVERIIAWTFAIGGAFAGVAGMLNGMTYPRIFPYIGIQPGLKAFIAAVLGGIGSIPGAVLGAYIMGLAETFASAYNSLLGEGIAFAILIVVLLVRPRGLLGEKSADKI